VIADKNGLVWINDLSGGLNDTDAPQDLAANQCTIAQNVEWVTTKFAQRRQGGTNGIHATEPWSAQASLLALLRHTPTADEGAAELFAIDTTGPPVMGRLAGGNQFAAVTVTDSWATTGNAHLLLNGVSLNGKFFVAGDTSVDRLHVIESGVMRRVGLATPAAPTAADTGAGSYAATTRYYKVQWRDANAANRPHSELSPALTFTPSGSGTHARVTRPSLPGETESHWYLWGSPDNVNYYLLAKTAVGTSTFDDNTNPSDYAGLGTTILGTTNPSTGFPTDADYFTPPHSPKYILADEDRLILLSSWETASMASAVMWTPVLGTTPPGFAVSDDERLPSTSRLDLDRSDGGGITGGGLMGGSVWVFKLSHIYELARTGNVDLPYRVVWSTKALGAISHKSIVQGEDDFGRECLYFLSQRGPYRLGARGLEYLGRDIETLWGTVNRSASPAPFGVWHQTKRQVQWWVTTGAASLPDKKLVLHVRHTRAQENGDIRGGWAVHTEGAADAYCACMFANTLGATMSLDLKPYVGQKWVTSLPDGPCIKYDADGTYTDRGGNQTTYIARVKPGAFPPGGPGMKGRVTQAYVLGTPANRSLALDVVEDFGARTRSGTVPLPAASASETRELVKVDDDARAANAMYVEIVLDDDVSPASSAAWTVDAIGLRVRAEGQI
jgi:hypothetical protein